MNLDEVCEKVILPAFAELPMSMGSAEAAVMLLGTGQQESRFIYRRQLNNGPAKGFWQFERGGGVKGVMQHHKTVALARKVVLDRGLSFDAMTVWNALEADDVLACIFARLLLFANPKPLPKLDEPLTAWNYYLESWRPGKPHQKTWPGYHSAAVKAVRSYL